MVRVSLLTALCLLMAAGLLLPPASALYDFEGLPLAVTAQGAVQGDLLTYGKYGLDNPPYELRFSLPAAPRFARVYTGIWGGTEKYTGWADLVINNKKKVRYLLYGDRDQNRDLYESGHGIYWIAYDPTDLLGKGDNVITVTTSKDAEGNRLDGRVYAVLVVAAVDNPSSGTLTRYWLAEGNENLHGEGWAGTNPTRHDEANVTFTSADLTGLNRANLSVLLLAGGKGQPDYVELNGRTLGLPVRVVNGTNVTDIGDEVSFDAECGPGVPSKYVDMETFDVTTRVQDTNTVRFLRGRDLDGDGIITTTGDSPEGEDYIHPVLALLTLSKSGSAAAVDLAAENLRAENAYTGEPATMSVEIRSYGAVPRDPVTVAFRVDGKTVNATQVQIPSGGVAVVRSPWMAEGGTHTISAEVQEPSDSRPENNAVSRVITLGTPPDLALTVGAPVHKEASAGVGPTKAPLGAIPALAALGALFLVRRYRPPRSLRSLVVLIVVIAAIPGLAVPAGAVSGAQEYTLPLTITNNGGSDAPAFTVTVWLDGENVAEKTVEGGVRAHASVPVTVPVFTAPGTHLLKIVVDEAGHVRDSNRENNLVQGRYEFPA